MPIGTTAVIIIASLSALGVGGLGFLAGRATAPGDAEELAEVRGLVEAQGETLSEVAEVAGRPVVIDAEIRDKLAETPPACIADPLGLACQVQACWQYGQSAAQRPECGDIQDAYLARQACPEPEPER